MGGCENKVPEVERRRDIIKKSLCYTSACMDSRKRRYAQKTTKRSVKGGVTKKGDQFLSPADRLTYIYIIDRCINSFP
jgi:hypothetical protein